MYPLSATKQTTLAQTVSCSGIGLHKGEMVNLVLRPAEAGTGVMFRRTDIDGGLSREAILEAKYDKVIGTMLGTVIANESGAAVSTIEHLMAALAGCGVDNVIVEVDAAEVPVMDGSSMAFVDLIETAGLKKLDSPRKVIRIKKPVYLEDGMKKAALLPSDGFSVSVEIDFDNKVIGQQTCDFEMTEGSFKRELCDCRTFGFLKDIQFMHENGLGLGGSLDNAIVLDGDEVLNEDGLRRADEFVRHKVLDAIGDLYLAGYSIQGRFEGVRSGHDINNKLLHALFAQPDAWELTSEPVLAEAIADHDVTTRRLAVA